jgi:hypothetical protein
MCDFEKSLINALSNHLPWAEVIYEVVENLSVDFIERKNLG